MTEASKWRLDLARQIAPIYANDSRVEAIAVAGSVGRGCADRWSDVEIGVYWKEEPTAEERRAMVSRFGILDGDPTPFEMDGEDPGCEESDDDVYVGGGVRVGTNVELKHKTIQGVEAFFGTWARDELPSGLRFPEAMTCAIPLYNEDLIAAWQESCALYPDVLVQQEIDSCLSPGRLWQLRQAVEDDDFVALRHTTARLVVGIIDTLCALNRFYTPSWKWNRWTIDRLKLKPDHLWVRIQSLFQTETDEVIAVVDSLLDDCIGLAGQFEKRLLRARERLEEEMIEAEDLPEHTDADQEGRIRHALDGFQWPWSNRVSFYCYRADMFHHAMFCRRVRQLLYLLGAVNDLPGATTAFRLQSILLGCERIPGQFGDRVRACFTPDLPEGTARLDELIEEAIELTRKVLDEQEVDSHLARFKGARRIPWDGPPSLATFR